MVRELKIRRLKPARNVCGNDDRLKCRIDRSEYKHWKELTKRPQMPTKSLPFFSVTAEATWKDPGCNRARSS